MKYRFLPDIATADLAFEAYGADFNELFENAGLALESAQVEPKSIEPKKKYTISKASDSVENLLLSFLEELVFLKDAERLVFNKLNCSVGNEGDKWNLDVDAKGDEIDPKKHKLGVDVKAVTKHMFEVKKLSDKSLRCQVILDV